MSVVRPADLERDRDAVRALFWEYLQWANARLTEEFEVTFDITSMLERDMAELHVFAPPDGGIVVVEDDVVVVGLGCLKRSIDGVAEIKRMYVRPDSRRSGAGRAVLYALLAEAGRLGYGRVRLDSAGFMTAAHAMYRSAGFRDIEAYPESEIPPEFRHHWVFMEKDLDDVPSGRDPAARTTA